MSSNDYLVTSLPLLSNSNSTQYAGSIPIPETTRNLFFWYFPVKQQILPPPQTRLLFWFAGGPGCSSLTGPFSGNGPLELFEDGTIGENAAWSWNELAHVVYVDSPFGTGYTRREGAAEVTSEEEVAEDFLKFLLEFLNIFPELKKTPVYLVGQGYAGVSVPYMARSILGHNRRISSPDEKIHLQAIALGNGFVSPKFHYGSMRRYLEAQDLMDILSADIQRVLKSKHQTMMHHYYEAKAEPIPFHHWDMYKTYLLDHLKEATADCFDWHDVSKVLGPEDCESHPLEIKRGMLQDYFNDDATRIALRVPAEALEWKTCRTDQILVHDKSLPSYMLFKELLQDIRIVMYNGDNDMEANYVGTEEFLKSIPWGGRITPGWTNPNLVFWGKVEGTEDEFMALGRSERRLTYLRILNTGYEVSEYKPEVAYRILDDIVFQESGSAPLEPPPGSTDQFSKPDPKTHLSVPSTTTTTITYIFVFLFLLAGIFLCVRYRRMRPADYYIRDLTLERETGMIPGGVTEPRRRQGTRGRYSPVVSGFRLEGTESSGDESE